MPEAYDVDGGVNQEKRFSVAMQRYRLFSVSTVASLILLTKFWNAIFAAILRMMYVQG